jgi:hypothetical protein
MSSNFILFKNCTSFAFINKILNPSLGCQWHCIKSIRHLGEN